VGRLLRRLLGVVLVLAGLAVVAGKLWLDATGPYLESLTPYPFCERARAELEAGRPLDAMELAEAGGCEDELAAARSEWDRLGAVFRRCVHGVWTGRAEDGVGIGCAIASDLVVLGDVRDLARQGVAWLRGEETDEMLVALSAAGLALTFAPQVGAGNDLLKAARRAGALSEGLAGAVVRLVRERAWRPLADLLGSAGRMSLRLGPARATRALAYADDADELARVARFAESSPSPLLGLRWGGKGAARLTDESLYAAALARGPSGVELAVRRGSRALLSRQPLVIAAAKALYRGDASALAVLLLRRATWPWVGTVAAAMLLLGAAVYRSGARRGGRGDP
jgi:hypothetical protein